MESVNKNNPGPGFLVGRERIIGVSSLLAVTIPSITISISYIAPIRPPIQIQLLRIEKFQLFHR